MAEVAAIRPASARSYAGEAPAVVQPLASHREHRVTVPMPKSLDELRAVAQRRFRNGRGLYHHGHRHLAHPNHMADVGHDDVVVVGMGGEEDRDAPQITTSRSHYVKHPAEPRPPSPPEPHPGEPGKWYGESKYGTDYAPRPYQRPRPDARPPDGLRVSTGPTGKSTYRSQYPWLDADKPERQTNYERHYRPGPMDGASSYQSNFNATQTPRPRSLKPPFQRPKLPGEFYGSTTYGEHYLPSSGARTASLGRPPALFLGDAPFDGTSEYAHRFVKHPHEHKALLHIEPQRLDTYGG